MEKLLKTFSKENSLSEAEKDLLNQKVYGQIDFGQNDSKFWGRFMKLALVVALGVIVPLAVFIFKPDSKITETVTKKVSAQAILEEAVGELEKILSNSNYVRYKLVVERHNSPLEGQIYTKDDVLVEIDTENNRYNFYDAQSSDFEEFVRPDGSIQYFFGQGYTRISRDNREYYGYLNGDFNSGEITLERVRNEAEVGGYYEFPEGILEQMQINHVEFYKETIKFLNEEIKPEEFSEDMLTINGMEYEVYKIPFEYTYTSFDMDHELTEDLFSATIYVDKNTMIPVRIEDKRDLIQGAVEVITTDLIEVEYELHTEEELDSIFDIGFDTDIVEAYDPYITSVEELKIEGVFTSGNTGKIFNAPKIRTGNGLYEIKSQKYYDPFINLPTILGRFLQGREVVMTGYMSGSNFIPVEYELIKELE